MTKSEWGEAVEWLAIRYPWDGWTNTQRIDAYYQDLAVFQPEDVWWAIHMYHEQGHTRAPLSSQLGALARDSTRNRIKSTPALPPETDTMTWKEYSLKYYGRAISLKQAALLELNKDDNTTSSPW